MRHAREINPISLRIEDQQIHNDFKGQSIEGALTQFRFAYVMAILAFALFIFVDAIIYQTFFSLYLKIRLMIILPTLALCLGITFTRAYKVHAIVINMIAALVTGLGTVFMVLVGHQEAYINHRFVSIILILFFVYSFFKLSYRHAFSLGMLITVAYLWVDYKLIAHSDQERLAIVVYALVANLIGTAIAYLIEYQSKKEFLLKYALSENVIKDALTGLYNRHYFDQVLKVDLENFIARSKGVVRIEQRLGDIKTAKYGLFMVDIDYFKRINDTFGHYSGDLVLEQFADLLKRHVRRSDDVLRVGGEEFLVVLKLTSDHYLIDFMKKIGRLIEEHDFVVEGGRIIGCTVSMGLMVIPSTRTDDVAELLKFADRALYRSKDRGRNRGHRAYELQGEVEFEEINWHK